MLQRFIKRFVKNSEHVHDATVRTAYGVLASIVGLLCNVALFLIKFILGGLLQSLSITADAWNNLADASTSFISLVGIKLAEKPADKEHPFGHGRIEYVTALLISFFILLVGLLLIKDAYIKIINPLPITFNWWLVSILIASIFVKVFLNKLHAYMGHKIHSSILKTTAIDARNDILITGATILSLFVEYFTGWLIDGWIGMLVALFVVYSGIQLAKSTLKPLLGEAIDKKLYETIQTKINSYPGVIGSHDLMIHNYGPTIQMATIHVEVAKDSSLEAVHTLIDQIEDDLFDSLGMSLVIHVDPVAPHNAAFQKSKAVIEEILHMLEPEADLHDFQVKLENKAIQLSFDLVVPYTYEEEDKIRLLTSLEIAAKKTNPHYELIIHIENSFVSDE